MKTILFRAKRLDNNQWVEGVPWFYDKMYEKVQGVPCCLIHAISYKPELNSDNIYYCEAVPVDPNTVCQFTGLTDNEGKRIFEGDALKLEKNMSGQGFMEIQPIVFARWEVCGWVWETLERSNYYRVFPYEMWEYRRKIVGNRYDNPELV